MPLKENGQAQIKFTELAQDKLECCIIEDNGVGRAKSYENKKIQQATHQSKSTNITSTRLQLTFKNPDKFNVAYQDLETNLTI